MNKLILTGLIGMALNGCVENSNPITQDNLEAQRVTSKMNTEYNATLYRTANPRLEGFNIIARPDTHITKECPGGDGWADLNFMIIRKGPNPKATTANPLPDIDVIEKVSAVCSTYSLSLGCYRLEDAKKMPEIVSQFGKCNKDIPYPLKSLQN